MMANSYEDSIVTLGDVIQAQQEMIEDADAVLGAGDDKNCTYSEGYMKRQALYACLTCNLDAKVDPSKRAGVCLACCYHCHDGHDLVELYTKRNFRCDCGNSKFPTNACNLNKCKDENNALNNYNQNFSGLYCICSRPYPDADDEISDEMIQCIVCEDWFHTRHLGCNLQMMNSYAEMTCKSCVEKHSFLLHYDKLCVTIVKNSEEEGSVNVDNIENNTAADEKKTTEDNSEEIISKESSLDDGRETDLAQANNTNDSIFDSKNDSDSENKNNGLLGFNSEEQKKTQDNCVNKPEEKEENNDITMQNLKESGNAENVDVHNKTCMKPTDKSDEITAKFWGNINWRQSLCTCDDCMKMYKEQNVLFLIDSADTVQCYEEKGKVKSLENAQKQEEDSIKFLNSVNRVPLMETLAAYNDLKENLTDYLKKFAENKKVVREEDIREFFSNFEAKKKQKVEVPSMCR